MAELLSNEVPLVAPPPASQHHRLARLRQRQRKKERKKAEKQEDLEQLEKQARRIEQLKSSLRQEIEQLNTDLASIVQEQRTLCPSDTAHWDAESDSGAEDSGGTPPAASALQHSSQEATRSLSGQLVRVRLRTLNGVEHALEQRGSIAVGEAKLAAAADLGHPGELQRWILGARTLTDGERLRDLLSAGGGDGAGASRSSESDPRELEVSCLFMPRTFNVTVKVIRWAPPKPSETEADVLLPVAPNMTIDAVKMELASHISVRVGTFMLLLKGSIKLDDSRTVESYSMEEGSVIYLLLIRS